MNANGSRSPSAKARLRKELGRRILEARKRRGWSQVKLARRLEVSRELLGKWERGQSAPSLEDAAKLSEVLEVTFEELVRGGPPGPRIPPAQRSEVAMCLNAFLRAIRPWLQPPNEKEKKEE